MIANEILVSLSHTKKKSSDDFLHAIRNMSLFLHIHIYIYKERLFLLCFICRGSRMRITDTWRHSYCPHMTVPGLKETWKRKS